MPGCWGGAGARCCALRMLEREELLEEVCCRDRFGSCVRGEAGVCSVEECIEFERSDLGSELDEFVLDMLACSRGSGSTAFGDSRILPLMLDAEEPAYDPTEIMEDNLLAGPLNRCVVYMCAYEGSVFCGDRSTAGRKGLEKFRADFSSVLGSGSLMG